MWFDDGEDGEGDEDGDGSGEWEVEEISGNATVGDVEVVDEWSSASADMPDAGDGPSDDEGRPPSSPGQPASGPDERPSGRRVVAPGPEIETPGDQYPRGTFVFPGENEEFLQMLELRGQNGASEPVETVYVLTGDNFWQPTNLFALHDPTLYRSATVDEVVSKIGSMADQIASQIDHSPKLIAYAHTHPNGSTSPSAQDRFGVRRVQNTFAEALGADDYEYFHIIHALGGEAKGEVERRSPTASGSGVYWYGEYRRHELAVFDTDYTPVEVRVR